VNRRAKNILKFWFLETSLEQKFIRNDDFDKTIRDLFYNDYNKAASNVYDGWQDNAEDCLALIILLDQFSRNLFRNDPKAFDQDYKARLIANEGIDRGFLNELTPDQIHFFLLPLIHSEDISDHVFCHKLLDTYLNKHKEFKRIKKSWNNHTDPIRKFGRYPHRNKVLKRKNTPAEHEYLNSTNYRFFNI
tara:strand:+ start:195 stop:764 length:570 start_codon:yes stop_codon:yes gene_type:complete